MRKFVNYIFVFLFISFLFPKLTYADMYIPLPPTPWYDYFLGVPINLVINSVLLIVLYLLFKKAHLIKSFKFIYYLFFVTLGGALIDYIFILGSKSCIGPPFCNIHCSGEGYFYILLTSILLFILNLLLSIALLKIDIKKASIVGLVIGILTNPGLFYIVYFGVYYIFFVCH